MIKEKTIDALYRLGFTLEELEADIGYRFDYEGMNLLYTAEDDDANSITFIMPGIFNVTDENRVAVLEAMIKLSLKVKYVQPVIMLDGVWLQYQHYIEEDQEPTDSLIEHMIRVLTVSTMQFHNILNEESNDE